MARDYIDFQDRSVPLGFLITFRCYGTWLHGDERRSTGRRGSNAYGEPRIAPSDELKAIDSRAKLQNTFLLNAEARKVVDRAIREVCEHRDYRLFALNVRTNHVHLVTNARDKVERMMDTFKAYSTRALRAAGLIDAGTRPWSRHGSTKYLWTDEHIAAAVEYVVNRQGGELPSFD